MAQELEELALFPLDTVLFPYAQLRLHVFEDRYREMIRDCLNTDRPFGVVLIRSGSEVGDLGDPYLVGTVVRLVSVDTYEDGRMDVQVMGERRFRIRRLEYDAKPYLVGYVEPVVELEIDDPERAISLLYQAREHYQALVEYAFASQSYRVQVNFPSDPVVLSFALANLLPLENLQKQFLLETVDTLDRVEELLPHIQTQLLESREPSFYKVRSRDFSEWVSPN